MVFSTTHISMVINNWIIKITSLDRKYPSQEIYMKKSKILKERKCKKQTDFRSVKRNIKTYTRVLTDETLSIEFD